MTEIHRRYPQYPKTTLYQHMNYLDRKDVLLSWWACCKEREKKGKGCIRNAEPGTRKKELEDVWPSLWLPFHMTEVWLNVFDMKEL